MLQDPSDVSLSETSSSNLTLSKAGFSVPMPGLSRGVPFSLDTITATYNPASHNEWPQGNQSQAGYPSTCVKQEPLSIPVQESMFTLQASTSSLLQHPPPYRTDKTVDLNVVKQEQKEAAGNVQSKHHSATQSVYPPPVQLPQPQPLLQKLTLDKYREKHTAELTVPVHKRRQELLHGGLMDCDLKGDFTSSSTYASSSIIQADHKKHVQPHQSSHVGNITASPMKMKAPSFSASGQDRRHHSDKRDKAILKVRLPVSGSSGVSQPEKSGQPSKDELKMRIKVSSERHSSSDEGITANNKTKHSSMLLSKEKHGGAEYNLHRPHKHGHPTTHSGNGRGGTEGPGGAVGLLSGPPGLVPIEGTALSHPVSTSLTSSSRKRVYPEGSYNHHLSASSSSSCSKVSKISKGAAGVAGTLSFSSPLSPCSSPVLQCVSSDSQHCG